MADYEVVTARTIGGLQDRVREMMSTGLRPLGGIAMLHEEQAGQDKLHMVFAQAVVREAGGPASRLKKTIGTPAPSKTLRKVPSEPSAKT